MVVFMLDTVSFTYLSIVLLSIMPMRPGIQINIICSLVGCSFIEFVLTDDYFIDCIHLNEKNTYLVTVTGHSVYS